MQDRSLAGSVLTAGRPRLPAVALITLLVGLLAVGPTADAAATGATPTPSAPQLTEPRPCAGSPGFTCWTLRVPLDHTGKVPGELRLQVAAADNVAAPKGVLLFLPGGPGLAGVPLVSGVAQRLAGLAHNYRLVTLDQRGTGEFAAQLPGAAAAVGQLRRGGAHVGGGQGVRRHRRPGTALLPRR